MSFPKPYSNLRKLIKTKLCACILPENQQSYEQKRCIATKEFSLTLSPDLDQLLNSGSIKHRKHPGVKKMLPILLPPNLVAAVDKLMCDENEKSKFTEAAELLKDLASRRLPMEMDEMNWRIKKRVGEDEGALDELTKEQKNHLKREINYELKRWKPIEYDYHHSLAYLVGRLAANYASTYKIFSQIQSEVPTFQPKSFFDFGSGLGTAVWAAKSTWGESIEEYFCVDSSSDMNDLSETLLINEDSGEAHIKNVFYRQFLPASETIKYDLVVSAFSLMDLPSAEYRVQVIDTLWRKTNEFLVIIEFGNLAGFHSVLDARDYILQVENSPTDELCIYSSGAHVLMPCPHEVACPMLKNKQSCGTFVTYESLFPRHRKEMKKDWISYVVLRKGPRPPDSKAWPRIVKPVLKKDHHVYCRMCCSNGKLNEVIVTRSEHGRNVYRCARQSNLGDSLPVNVEARRGSANCEGSDKSQTVD